jgi:cation diffusion facilitator CzcD-associated flavoprotein CzcO
MSSEHTRLTELAERIHQESEIVAYPKGDWVAPLADKSGKPIYDVLIVGAGQSGLAVAQGLIRDGVKNILLIDRNPEGFEGPWRTYARMTYLRTPKFQTGMDHGLPSLTTRAWYEAKYGAGSWGAVERVSREDWAEYVRWYRKVLDLPVRNGVEVVEVLPEDKWFKLAIRGAQAPDLLRARRVVLATGYEGYGQWRIPPAIAAALPADRCVHSNTIIDFARFRDKRLGILGNGASAFDAAVAALRHGATSVDICFRRTVLPTVNPHRVIEFAGFLKHFPDADDAMRWSLNYHFDTADQPPARHSFDTAHGFANFAMHPGSPWLAVGMEDGAVRVRTPQRSFAFDQVICATGSVPDPMCRPELASFASDIAQWRDRYTPPADEAHEVLGGYPYLGPAMNSRNACRAVPPS